MACRVVDRPEAVHVDLIPIRTGTAAQAVRVNPIRILEQFSNCLFPAVLGDNRPEAWVG